MKPDELPDLNVTKIAAYLPVTGELPHDAPDLSGALFDALADAVNRRLRPWRYPDHNPMPTIVLFPRLARVAHWFNRHEETP